MRGWKFPPHRGFQPPHLGFAAFDLTICLPRIRWRSESHLEKDENDRQRSDLCAIDLKSNIQIL
jgi:hypothetical protein